MTNLNLVSLNAFRALNNLAPFADWRAGRHAAPLAAYESEYAASVADMFADLDAAAAIAAEAAALAEASKDLPVAEVAPVTKRNLYKQMPKYVPSKVESPLAFVHGFLNANADMKRKDAMLALVEDHGVNFATARTQYQKWFALRKAAASNPANAAPVEVAPPVVA